MVQTIVLHLVPNQKIVLHLVSENPRHSHKQYSTQKTHSEAMVLHLVRRKHIKYIVWYRENYSKPNYIAEILLKG